MLLSGAYSATQFREAANMKAYDLDGRQQTYVAQCWGTRVNILEAQLIQAGVLSGGMLSNAAAAMAVFRSLSGLIIAIAKAKTYDPNCSEVLKTLLEATVELTDCLEKGIDIFLAHATPYFDVLCITAYVGMLALGQVAFGSIGLAAVALTQIKQYGYLPGFVDDFMTPLGLAASVAAIWTVPAFIIFKVLGVVVTSIHFIDYLVANDRIRPYLPSCLTSTSQGEHIIPKDRAIDTYFDNHDVVNGLIDDPEAWEINMTHVHAPEMDNIIPKDLQKQLDTRPFKEIYESLEPKIERLAKFSEAQQAGWKEIQSSMINNTCKDVRPTNFDQTKNVIKTILLAMLEEDDDDKFVTAAKTLAEVGNSCTEGWLRDCNFLLDPRSKDYKWMAHYILAQQRSALLQDGVNKLEQGMKQMGKQLNLPGSSFSLEVVGGANNIHLLNQTAGCLSDWRTSMAEIHFANTGRGVVTRAFQARMGGQIPEHLLELGPNDELYTKENILRTVYTGTQMTLPLPIPPVIFATIVNEVMYKNFVAERLIEEIQSAIKPVYVQVKVVENTNLLDELTEVLEIQEEDLDPKLVTKLKSVKLEKGDNLLEALEKLNSQRDLGEAALAVSQLLEDHQGALASMRKGERTQTEERAYRQFEWQDCVEDFVVAIDMKTEIQNPPAVDPHSDDPVINPNVFNLRGSDYQYDKRIIDQTVHGDQYLTDAGTRLLLWHMGIIQPKKEAAEEAKVHMTTKEAGTPFKPSSSPSAFGSFF